MALFDTSSRQDPGCLLEYALYELVGSVIGIIFGIQGVDSLLW